MKKIYTIAIVSFLVIASLGISIYQYISTTKADLANAASTKPANGHSWAEMEADSDSIQVTGQTITNLAAPVNASDAVPKSYVDAAGGAYSTCYTAATTSCASGFTMVASNLSGVYSFGGVCAGTPTPTPAVAWSHACWFTMGSVVIAPAFYGNSSSNAHLYMSIPGTPQFSGVGPVANGVFCCK